MMGKTLCVDLSTAEFKNRSLHTVGRIADHPSSQLDLLQSLRRQVQRLEFACQILERIVN